MKVITCLQILAAYVFTCGKQYSFPLYNKTACDVYIYAYTHMCGVVPFLERYVTLPVLHKHNVKKHNIIIYLHRCTYMVLHDMHVTYGCGYVRMACQAVFNMILKYLSCSNVTG